MRARRERGGRGFTLVEVLVALVLAALLTGILLNGASLARRRGNDAQHWREALFVASNMLTEAVVSPFSREARSGSVNGLKWSIAETVLTADPRGLYALVELDVRVIDASGRPLADLQTRKVKVLPRT